MITASKASALPLPLEITPLVGGLGGLFFAIVLGYFATKQRATAFAMITLGIGELITACALMFQTFFGGEGGVSTNRMTGHSLFGLAYAASIQVYYLIVAWTAISIALMLLLTRTPLGRMANACRDNFERAQFVGYDPRLVRFFQFALSGFFAGIAGALYTLTYEIVTFDTVAASMSANALLMTYIGGVGVFRGARDRRGADRAAPELGEPALQLLARLRGGALHPHGHLRPRRHRRPRDDAPADLAGTPAGPPRRALLAIAGPRPAGGGRLRAGGRAVLLPHHRRRAGQDLHPVARHHRAAHPAAVGGGRGAAGRRRSLAAPRGGRVRAGLARGRDEIKAAGMRA